VFVVNGIANPPLSYATIDDAITALAGGDGTILLCGCEFRPESPAAAPTQPITSNVTLTSVNPLIPAVITNANLIGINN
jgi:hypothetical protein